MGTQDPAVQRRGQIEREIEKLTDPKNRKTQRDFKSTDGFANWIQTNQSKLDELRDELSMLEFPEGFNECPIAIAAQELGLTLSDMQWIVTEGLIEISSAGYYPAGYRMTREELGRAIEVGPEELMRRPQMKISEIFAESLAAVATGNANQVRMAFERIEHRDSCINPYALPCEGAIHFLENDLAELHYTINFILKREFDDSLAALDSQIVQEDRDRSGLEFRLEGKCPMCQNRNRTFLPSPYGLNMFTCKGCGQMFQVQDNGAFYKILQENR